MTEALFVARLIHILSGIGWFGEVLTVNLVLIPALVRVDPALRARILTAVFPFVFRLATVLAGTAVVSGAIVFLLITRGNLALVADSDWGRRILVGGVMGAVLFAFHLLQESRWEGSLASRLVAAQDDPAASEAILRRLQVIPRVGLLVLLVVIGLMSAAARLP
ncbi:MAG: hypothetical protein R3C32_06375 [Chloroflexota bacterium]